MNAFNRIVSCSAIAAIVGASGCILPPGHMRHGDQRERHHESHRDDHGDDQDDRNRGNCDPHRENCRDRERYAP